MINDNCKICGYTELFKLNLFQDTPIMRSNRTRSRSRNEERTFSMSTRSTPSSKDSRPPVSPSENGDHGTLVSDSSPTRSGRLRKAVSEKPLPRRRNERLKSAGSPGGQIQLATTGDTNVEPYCEMDADRCGPVRKCAAKQLVRDFNWISSRVLSKILWDVGFLDLVAPA